MRILVTEYQGTKVVDSYDFYIRCGLSEGNYTQWVVPIIERAALGRDYFCDPELLKINPKVKKRYWFSSQFASGLAFSTSTRFSLELRKWLV